MTPVLLFSLMFEPDTRALHHGTGAKHSELCWILMELGGCSNCLWAPLLQLHCTLLALSVKNSGASDIGSWASLKPKELPNLPWGYAPQCITP